MLPFRDIQLLAIGAAAVIDTALLFALFERRNWRRVVLPVVVLIIGAWLYHVGAFIVALVLDTTGLFADLVRFGAMTAMAAGLLTMPSAMLHAVLRLRVAGLSTAVVLQRNYAAVYLPLLAIIPIAVTLANNPHGGMLDNVGPFVWPYLIWLTIVNVTAAIGFHRLRDSVDLPRGRLFFSLLVAGLLLLTAFHWFELTIAIPLWPDSAEVWQLALVLSPLTLILLFAYFILRYNFMQLVLERTIVYGLIVIGVVLAHRFILRDFLSEWDARFRFDFAFVEAAVLVFLVLAYRPLRQRTAEALRYLMGERVTTLREQTRRMAMDMANRTGQSPPRLLSWFVEAVREALQVERMVVLLMNDAGAVSTRGGATAFISDGDACLLHTAMREQRLIACRLHDAPTGLIDDTLRRTDARLVVVIDHPRVSGLVLLGPRRLNRSLSDEQVSMIVMLVEQLSITVNNSLLQAERLAAERRALQNEKLSTLGLVAGSIAHEVKNPLSSIKTIASVLAEDLRGTPHAQDLGVIIGEIDRLSTTVSRLLQFARPASQAGGAGSLLAAIQGTLAVLRHLAKEQSVLIIQKVPTDLPDVTADENMLREIVFNLVSNAIDAAGAGGQVTVTCRGDGRFAELCVSDNGPGLTPLVQDRLFEPFVTTKEQGTGLGLYVVGRHVREIGGEIHCETEAAKGTRFIVRLPSAGSLPVSSGPLPST